MSQTIHGLRRDIDVEYEQVVHYSNWTVYAGIKLTIKGDVEYKNKSSDFDTLWLLQKKKTTAGVDKKPNPSLNLHEQIIIFLVTKQGQKESEDKYLSGINSHLENMNMARGTHILCSPKSIGKELRQCTTV